MLNNIIYVKTKKATNHTLQQCYSYLLIYTNIAQH